MNGTPDILDHIPYIALFLCYALGSGIYIGLAQWTRGIAHGHYNHKTPFQTITPWLKAAFITVLLASLVRQALFIAGSEASYNIEITLLAALTLAFILKRKFICKESAREITANALHFVKRIGLYCLFTSLLWAVLMGFFLLSLMLVQAINAVSSLAIDAFQVSIMATGLIALSPFHIWYKKAKEGSASGHLETPSHYKFHHILWPFIVGLLLFILPLFMEKVAGSDKFDELMNAKPSLELI